jgi:hypothetical protein
VRNGELQEKREEILAALGVRRRDASRIEPSSIRAIVRKRRSLSVLGASAF